MTSLFDLSGRVALLTGAGRGLGFEIAKAFAQAGATVYINGSSVERLDVAKARFAQEGLEARTLPFDVSDRPSMALAVDRIVREQGRLDILVNNVGARLREPLDKISDAELALLLDKNVVSAFALSKRCAESMKKGDYGRIINISSTSALRGRKGDAAYIISKGGINSMTLAMAAEFGPFGITSNAILPGTFRTETNESVFTMPGIDDYFRNRVLLQRGGRPSEIAGAALFLASPAASYVTGALLPVDGGYLAAG